MMRGKCWFGVVLMSAGFWLMLGALGALVPWLLGLGVVVTVGGAVVLVANMEQGGDDAS